MVRRLRDWQIILCIVITLGLVGLALSDEIRDYAESRVYRIRTSTGQMLIVCQTPAANDQTSEMPCTRVVPLQDIWCIDRGLGQPLECLPKPRQST